MTASATKLKVRTVPAINPPIIWPEVPAISEDQMIYYCLAFMLVNPYGVRNCEVARALGVTRKLDPRNWFSYGILQMLQDEGWVLKDSRSRYTLTPAGTDKLRSLEHATS